MSSSTSSSTSTVGSGGSPLPSQTKIGSILPSSLKRLNIFPKVSLGTGGGGGGGSGGAGGAGGGAGGAGGKKSLFPLKGLNIFTNTPSLPSFSPPSSFTMTKNHMSLGIAFVFFIFICIYIINILRSIQ